MNPTSASAASSEHFVYLDRTEHTEGTNSYSTVPGASWVSGAVLKRGADLTEERTLCKSQVETVMINLRRQPTDLMLRQIIEDGKLHMDVRMQLLAQQVLLVYKTGYSYLDLKSRWRICHKIKQTPEPGDEAQSCYQAAHCNLFPELGLRPGSTGKHIPFPKTSWLCSTWNTTTLLPLAWNQTDTMLDGQNSNRSSFRAQITEVLNRAAQLTAGTCAEYFNEVMIKMAQRLEECMRHPRNGASAQYIIPLRCYREVVEQYLIRMRAGENMLAWACMERSLEREGAVRAVQMRIWEMTKIQAVSFLSPKRRFDAHAQLYQPMRWHQNLLRAPMGLLQMPAPVAPVQGSGVVTRSGQAQIMQGPQTPSSSPPTLHPVVAQAPAAPVATVLQRPQIVYFRHPVSLEKTGVQYKDHCLQDREIQLIARRHWQAGGSSTAELAPMKARMKVLIKARFSIQAPQHQDDIATCIFAQLYTPPLNRPQ